MNYRPISILSNFSKFLERVVNNWLIEFVQKYDILYSRRFGFRKNRSTSLPSIHLTNKTASAIDRHETTAGVFVDLSKAFDTMDHKILFGKLEHCGILGLALEWIKSYFSCRQKIIVPFNSTCSSKQRLRLLNVVSLKAPRQKRFVHCSRPTSDFIEVQQ